MARVLRSRPNLTFLQVGAFDGHHNDALFPLVQAHGLRGIIVEPQARAFEKLKAYYANQPQIILVNAAIANENGIRDFFTLADRPIPQASFSRAHLLKHKVPPDQIICQQVRCCTPASLLTENGLDAISGNWKHPKGRQAKARNVAVRVITDTSNHREYSVAGHIVQ